MVSLAQTPAKIIMQQLHAITETGLRGISRLAAMVMARAGKDGTANGNESRVGKRVGNVCARQQSGNSNSSGGSGTYTPAVSGSSGSGGGGLSSGGSGCGGVSGPEEVKIVTILCTRFLQHI